MKIVQVINSLAAGGAEVFVSQLSVELVRQGHEVVLLTYAGILDSKGESLNSYLTANGVVVIHNKRNTNFYSRAIAPYFFLRKNINRVSPDVIHAHLQMSDVYVAILNFFRLKKFKIFRTLHNSRGLTKLPKIIDYFLFISFNTNIACSYYVKENYIDKRLSKLLVPIPNGIDVSIIQNISETKKDLRRKLNLSLDKPIFINIGRMNSVASSDISLKNQGFIIDTVKRLSTLTDEEFYVIFLGDGELKKKFEKQTRDLGIQHICIFTGNVVLPYEYIKASDFCLMPSLNEGLPISLIEAVCTGLYSITSHIEAFKIFESNSVYRLSEFDIEEFSSKMLELISDKDIFLEKGLNNISFFNNKFGIRSTAEKHLDLFLKQIKTK